MEFRLILDLIDTALKEDLAWGDVTAEGLFDNELEAELALVLREDGVIAGLDVARLVFQHIVPEAVWTAQCVDGDFLKAGSMLATVKGRARGLVQSERTALNFLQHLSGVATLTHRYVEVATKANPNVHVTDTRKTIPGMRYLEKYAVRMGGGHSHRHCLADMVMIKDNHLALLGQQRISLSDAVKRLRSKLGHAVKIEVEVDRLEQLEEVLAAKVETVLLDNMSLGDLRKAVALIDGRMLAEASGGVNLSTIGDIAATGVDLISVGRLTHSVSALDIGLDYL